MVVVLVVLVVAKAEGRCRASGKEFPAQRWAFIHRGCRKNVKGVLFAERKIKNGFFHRPPIPSYKRRNTIHRYSYTHTHTHNTTCTRAFIHLSSIYYVYIRILYAH